MFRYPRVKPRMDVFSRTFRTAAADAGVADPTVSRHLPVFRRCVEADDATVLVSRCAGDFLLVLTSRRLVVTRETRFLHRLHLHLNADLRHLSNVTSSPDLRRGTVELAADAVDGVRERFLLRVPWPEQVWHVDEQLQRVFRSRAGAAARGPLAQHAEQRSLKGLPQFSQAAA
jgi:hypothetical protein